MARMEMVADEDEGSMSMDVRAVAERKVVGQRELVGHWYGRAQCPQVVRVELQHSG